MENKLGQAPAFPSEFTTGSKGEFGEPLISHRVSYGISKRFYAACAAMQGTLSNPNGLQSNGNAHTYVSLVEHCYKCADELLRQESL